jgi:hypothetical protein
MQLHGFFWESVQMKNDDDEPPVWVTALKLVVIAVVLIGGTGLALWYVDQMQARDQPSLGSGNSSTGWGIAGDNPLRFKR